MAGKIAFLPEEILLAPQGKVDSTKEGRALQAGSQQKP
jgi:hypothetical protein